MADIQNIHILYKNTGETPNQCILRFKKANLEYSEVPMTYAGRLDPLAEGLLLVICGDEIKQKDKYIAMEKTYRFEVLWGFGTDTFDALGLVSEDNKNTPSITEIKDYLKKVPGKFEQNYPAYSSRPAKGKPLWQWAREGKSAVPEVSKHLVEIFQTEHSGRKFIEGDALMKEIILKVNSVTGDFRQEEILKKWKETLKKNEAGKFAVDEIFITVSSGFYVRQFVSDMAKIFDTSATTFHIKRLSIGEFRINS